ncbi:alpha-mannosidase [Paenibacillus tarimensis]
MTYKRTAHLIAHTHWDREWYMPYEKHHVRLVQLMDTLLDTLDKDAEFNNFFLDGQTIIIEDYVQIRPERQGQLEKYIREGRIHIGPWYILQDAFLTSSEANLRNLQIGHKDAKRYGGVSKIGYFPDTFGNIGQAPQILKQAGIDNAVFGRGVKPTGFNNEVADAKYESSFSELIWQGPDGSSVLGILFANWYCNGMEVPQDTEEALRYWEQKLSDAEKYASTSHLLFMNGCDHQPVQTDLSEALCTARKLFPETEFVHSNFADYIEAVKRSDGRGRTVVKGELRSQRTDGWSTLVNTASARVYLKQMNQAGQALLEKAAEPLASIAALVTGRPYPQHLFTYAWKTLMQNHPHDSICGCSVDEVHREMVSRFERSSHVAETIVEDSMKAIADAVDTSGFEKRGQDAIPFVVFNTTGWERNGIVEIRLDAARIYFREGVPQEEMLRRMKEIDISGRMLIDAYGATIPCEVEDLGVRFGYDLPDDRFRQPYWCRRVAIRLEAVNVPALGLKAFAWVKNASEAASAGSSSSLLQGGRVMENGILRVEITDDGSLSALHKPSGRTYRNLCVYENTGDIGNEYMYKQPDGETPLTTEGLAANIRIVEDTPFRASVEITHEWEIPASADALFELEKREAVYFPARKSQRVSETVPLTIKTVVSLTRYGKGIEIETSFNNQAKDHRIRALFPTDLQSRVHEADAIFEIAVRDNEPAPEWTNPSNCQHQQAFVNVSETASGGAGASGGLTIANLGLNEYEILNDGRNTIAVTLLRSVSELGDWGVFPTPEAQCLGEHKTRLEIIPHSGSGIQSGAYAEAYQFQVPWTSCQTDLHGGTIPPVYSSLAWEGSGLAFSSMKLSEETGDMVVRWYNMGEDRMQLKLSPSFEFSTVYKSNVLEERGEAISGVQSDQSLTVNAAEIVTVGFKIPAES